MGGRVKFVNDIQRLREMLIDRLQVGLQRQEQDRSSVELTDLTSGTIVKIKGLPSDSIVIRADAFKDPLTIFNGTKGECARADFVIVSNDEHEGKWIICIETKGGNKTRPKITAQLKGAKCFISYCRCIGKSFWEPEEFLDGYEYRFVSIVRLNKIKKQQTQPFHSIGRLHNRPDLFLKIFQTPILHFRKLINLMPLM